MLAVITLGGHFSWFDTYFSLDGDGLSLCAHIKSLQEMGLKGLYMNYRLGAPGISSLYDDPGMDVLLSLEIILLNFIFSPSTAQLYYYTIIFSFVGTTISMFYLMKKVDLNEYCCLVFSILFSFAPYHFFRATAHITVANSISVPLAVLITLYLVGEVKAEKFKLFERIICGILLGFSFPYFVFFAFVIFAMAIFVIVIQKVELKVFLHRIVVVIITIISFIITRIPATWSKIQYGENTLSMVRNFADSEIYSIKIIQLLLPPQYTKLTFLKMIVDKYIGSGLLITESQYSSLGMVASLGFLLGFIILIIQCIRGNDNSIISILSLLIVGVTLVATVGGFGEIFNFLITPQMRCYNRFSIYISCMSLLLIACLISNLKKAVQIFMLSLIFCVGLFDQFTVIRTTEQYNVAAEQQKVMLDFFDEVQNKYDKNCMIYQLPYADYPEVGPIYNMADYSHFKAYIFTDDIKWSYGGVKGRDYRASNLNIDNGMSYRFLQGLKREGFSAVYIDLSGYGEYAGDICDFYDRLNCKKIESSDGNLRVYDIRNLEINENYCTDEYIYTDLILKRLNINYADKIVAELASSIYECEKNNKVYEIFMEGNEINDADYVIRLYQVLLKRSPTEDEIANQLQTLNIYNRQELFVKIIESEEFHMQCYSNE